MAGKLAGTKTEKNLKEAFAGEARKAGLLEIANVFETTANEEKEHAKRMFKYLDMLAATDAKPGESGANAGKASFAANLLDREESTLTQTPELTVDGKKATSVEGFTVGVRREIWIYLLVAAVILTAIEWATYHRRITV